MESSLSGHRCRASHGVSDGKFSEWNWQRGLIRARVNKEVIGVSTYVYMHCLVLKCILYTYPFLLAVVPYLWWHKCLICNAYGFIQCRL